ncbi:MAG: tRNA (adenosine(37)-N6)-dimethylallyltransferase MiaA [Candidatus Nanopelagicales bacterium]
MKVIAIVGPTAVGKSDLAINLSRFIEIEVINSDAMQLYKGMDIGTAKLDIKSRKNIVHHLIDVLSPNEEASVSVFQTKARLLINEIQQKGKTPVLVGGSGLYINAVLEDLEFPGTNLEIRAKYEEILEKNGVEFLYKELERIDPLAAKNILINNARRIVRALEVNELTGKNFNAKLPEPSAVFEDVRIGLNLERDILDKRIENRVLEMFNRGLVKEVEQIFDELVKGKTAQKALGYSQVIQYLKNEITLDQAIEQTIVQTRKYARRQISWFKRDPLIQWFDAQEDDLLEKVNRII